MEDMRTHMQDTWAGHGGVLPLILRGCESHPCILIRYPHQVPEKLVGAGSHNCGFSLAKSCPTLLNPMDCRMPVFPVLH